MTREEAIKELEILKEDYWEDDGYGHETKQYDNTMLALDMAIKALEQEPRKGHWIGHREHCENLGVMPSGLGVYEWCSNCDCGIDVREWHRNNYNYCPNCGSDNREVEE